MMCTMQLLNILLVVLRLSRIPSTVLRVAKGVLFVSLFEVNTRQSHYQHSQIIDTLKGLLCYRCIKKKTTSLLCQQQLVVQTSSALVSKCTGSHRPSPSHNTFTGSQRRSTCRQSRTRPSSQRGLKHMCEKRPGTTAMFSNLLHLTSKVSHLAVRKPTSIWCCSTRVIKEYDLRE